MVAGTRGDPLRPGTGGRQGGSTERRCRRLSDQAIRSTGVAGPGAGGLAARGQSERRGRRRVVPLRGGRPGGGPGRQTGERQGSRRPLDPDRVPPAGHLRQERREGLDPPLPAAGGLGPGMCPPDPLPADVRRQSAPQARRRPGRARGTCSPSRASATGSSRGHRGKPTRSRTRLSVLA